MTFFLALCISVCVYVAFVSIFVCVIISMRGVGLLPCLLWITLIEPFTEMFIIIVAIGIRIRDSHHL